MSHIATSLYRLTCIKSSAGAGGYDCSMIVALMLPAVLCFLVMAAHWLRNGNLALVAVSLAMLLLLWIPKPWMRRVVQVLLVLAALEWVRATYEIVQVRMEIQEAWVRAAVIMLVVAALNVLAAGLLQLRRARRWYRADSAKRLEAQA